MAFPIYKVSDVCAHVQWEHMKITAEREENNAANKESFPSPLALGYPSDDRVPSLTLAPGCPSDECPSHTEAAKSCAETWMTWLKEETCPCPVLWGLQDWWVRLSHTRLRKVISLWSWPWLWIQYHVTTLSKSPDLLPTCSLHMENGVMVLVWFDSVTWNYCVKSHCHVSVGQDVMRWAGPEGHRCRTLY